MIQLHTHPFSTFGRRVHIAILEKELDVQIIEVDLPQRAQRTQEYLAIHPYARVPALTEGDFKLAESNPILLYLEDRFPEHPLLPTELQQRALVRMHMSLCDLEFAVPSYAMIFSKRFVPEAKWRRDEMDACKPTIERHYRILEQQLEGKDFLVGDAFTLADVCYAPFLHFADLLEVDLPDHVRAYRERLLSRPSAIATKPPL